MYKNPLRRRRRKKVVSKIQDSPAKNTEEIPQEPKAPGVKRGLAISTYLAYKTYRKEMKKMKNPIKSTTTQNVAMGTVVGGGAVLGAIAFLRSFAPDWIFWDQEQDQNISSVLLVVVIPTVSRMIAFWRDPKKKEQGT